MSKNTTAMTRELVQRQLLERQVAAGGRQSGATLSPEALHASEHSDWMRRQAIQVPRPRYIEPTLPERINRLNPQERFDLQRLVRSLKLRKVVRRVLAEAHWERESAQLVAMTRGAGNHGSMQRLRQAVRTQESLTSYERALTSFEPPLLYQRKTYGPGIDSPAIKHALERSLIEVPR